MEAKEVQEFVDAINDTAVDYPRDQCIHQLFEQQAAQTPDAVAVVFEEQQLTYRELNERANRLAHYLRDQGVGPDVPVGVCMERSFEMVVALYGILKAGGCYVPLDPAFPRARIEHIVSETAMVLILAQSAFEASLAGIGSSVCLLDQSSDGFVIYSEYNQDQHYPIDSLAYIIYTSGSTGKPKGVMNEHRGILNRLLWMQAAFGLTPDEPVLQKTPYSFDVSVWEFFWPLMFGAKLVVAKPEGHKDAGYLVDTIQRHRITTLHFVPSMLEMFLTHPGIGMCLSLKRVICSGEALSYDLQERFYRRCSAELHNLYGPTEAAVDVSWWPCQQGDVRRPVPIGRPIANTQLYILDEELRYVLPGEEGELYIGGIQVARGYIGRPDLTAERFLTNPFRKNGDGRLYKTGDVCRYREDGAIEYLGRMDDQVKLRGFRIELGEIEIALRSHPVIQQAVVVCREDQTDQKYLAAYIVLVEKSDLSDEELKLWLSGQLPDYMVPSFIVRLVHLPLTGSGKVDRRSLPKPAEMQSARQGSDPQTSVEQTLAGIWQDLLGTEKVYREDNFFRLGGHSLKAIQVIYRLQSQYQIDLPVALLFQKPILADFAGQVEALLASAQARNHVIVPVDRRGNLPLSYAQQRMWFIHTLTPELPVYNIAWLVLLEGEINVEALERSLADLISRHESFRTTFKQKQGDPVQVINPIWPWRLSHRQVVVEPDQSVREAFEAVAKQEARRLFNLEIGPLFHFELLQADSNHYALMLTMHHLVTDGWSMGIFAQELSTLYRHYDSDEPITLAPLPVQYTDYANWQRSQLDQLLEQDFAYWQERLAGLTTSLTLPVDYPDTSISSYHGYWETYNIRPELYGQMRAFCRQRDCTLYPLLVAAFSMLLYRYTGVEDVVIGSPVAGRTHRDVENIIGFFVNTVVLRNQIKSQDTFEAVLRQVRQGCDEAQLHQHLPYDVLVERLNPERSVNRNLFFQTMLAYQDARYWNLTLPETCSQTVEISSGTAKIDMTLFIEENENGLSLRAEYAVDLFKPTSIQRFLRHYEQLLTAIVNNPSLPVGDLDYLLDTDRLNLAAWNDTAVDYPRDQCIHQLFEQQAAQTPEVMAVVFEDQSMSYRELNGRANRLAHYLRAQGIGPDTPVGVSMDRCPDLIVTLLGILKAGGTYVPLDPAYPVQRLQFMISDTGMKLIVTGSTLLGLFETDGVACFCLDRDGETLATYPVVNPEVQTQPDHLAYLIYTSGSTGTPKGVAVPHRGVVRLLYGQDYLQFGPERVFLQLAPVSFDASTLEIWGPLLHGGRCVLYPGRLPELDKLGLLISQCKIDTLFLTTGLFNLIIDQCPMILHPVKLVLTGGETMSMSHIGRALASLTDTAFINVYGPTENTTFTSFYSVALPLPDRIPSIPIGKPINNTRVYITDARMHLLPPGIWGELWVAGDGLARGYWKRPELTAERFIPNPFRPDEDDRIYRTGDICRWREDGTIEFGGRRDDQVKIRGFRIELGEIEQVLQQCPGVLQAVVVVNEEIPGQKTLTGYVVITEGAILTQEDIQKYLAERLADYMIPPVIMLLPRLPLTPNGKLDRQALPKPVASSGVGAGEAPHTLMERTLAAIWQELLGMDQIARDDNFFELGGHSLLAARLFYRIQKEFGVHLPLGLIFDSPTVGQLARSIQQAEREFIAKDIVQIKPGSAPASIFYLPGIGGYTLSFYHLAQYMSIPLRQYGLNLPGLDGHQTPCQSIEEIAGRFIASIRSVQPEGPYYLCGYSLGGRIGFEVAAQLRQTGQQVPLLIMLGATAPGYPKTSIHPWRRVLIQLSEFCRLSLADQIRYLRFRWNYYLVQRSQARESLEQIEQRVPHYASYKQVNHLAMNAWYQYAPSHRLDVPLVLFRETEQDNPLYRHALSHPTWGWDQFFNGTITVCDINSDHRMMFREPQVQSLAATVEREIMQVYEQQP